MFQNITKTNKAQNIEKQGDSVTGYFIGLRTKVGKFKSTMFQFRDKKSGRIVDVWGNIPMENTLCVGTRPNLKPNPDFFRKLVKVEGRKPSIVGKGKAKKTYKNCEIFVDPSDKV